MTSPPSHNEPVGLSLSPAQALALQQQQQALLLLQQQQQQQQLLAPPQLQPATFRVAGRVTRLTGRPDGSLDFTVRSPPPDEADFSFIYYNHRPFYAALLERHRFEQEMGWGGAQLPPPPRIDEVHTLLEKSFNKPDGPLVLVTYDPTPGLHHYYEAIDVARAVTS
eukprot:gnl/Hemi2/15922_TR5265_c0_g1_i1.p1 gnl/Hemi2/15922_TR5265_c0_g1~~gnl/Hemi2/15922_TR5265_c0_g1_i1.p1  ORF type:complete len:166 (+),score=88.66 gnl/Hemi2/15922_TR5265_c0_g1_i1:99-596(+)